MVNNKSLGTILSWVLLAVVLVALGISSFQSYTAIKIQDNLYSKVWDTLQPELDESTTEKTKIVYKMNIYDYTDCVLVNISIGSNDVFLDGAGADWEHTNWYSSKAYFKFDKTTDSDLKYSGVILYNGWRVVGHGTDVGFYGVETKASKILVQSCFEYILPGYVEPDWSKDGRDTISSFEKAIKNNYNDYVVTWQQQTDEAIFEGGIFERLYQLILADAENTNINTKTYTKQLQHITNEDLTYIKAFKDNVCVDANIYCEFTRQINTHSLPETLSVEWYETEIIGGVI